MANTKGEKSKKETPGKENTTETLKPKMGKIFPSKLDEIMQVSKALDVLHSPTGCPLMELLPGQIRDKKLKKLHREWLALSKAYKKKANKMFLKSLEKGKKKENEEYNKQRVDSFPGA